MTNDKAELVKTVSLFDGGQIDIFRKPEGLYWQSIEYREADGFFTDPVNGPFTTTADALADAEYVLSGAMWSPCVTALDPDHDGVEFD